MDRISVNIISPKLTAKGRRAEIFMLISFGLMFLAYPINLLTGEGILYMSIVGLIVLNMFFWVAYYYLVDKYDTIGEIVFDSDQVIVKEKTGLISYKIADISNLTVSYDGYEDEPFLTFYKPYMRSSRGHDNVLSFKSNDKIFEYRFAILNKTVRVFLNRQFEKYKKLGADIKIIEKHEFVEF
ncbi:MAG: hypothetical protein AB7P01_13670 [Bacteroidia bacterium]